MLVRVRRLYAMMTQHLLAAIMALLLAIMMLQVVSRYGLNASLIWAEEICRYLLIWVSFLGCAAAYVRGEIAAIELLERTLPRRAALILAIVKNILILTLLAFLVYFGWSYAVRIGSQPIPALAFLLTDLFGEARPAPLSMFWVYVAVPVGMALLAIHVVAQTIRYAGALRSADVGKANPFTPGGGER